MRLCAIAVLCLWVCPVLGGEFTVQSFQRQELIDTYYSEGVAIGDINNDGHIDVIYGPVWFEGPNFQTSHEIFPAAPQNRDRYANHFFAWAYDFNQDGWLDVLTVGFPGTAAFVYENPGEGKLNQHWKKHQVFDSVSNESPQFINIVGDERPELVCTRDGFFGFATINWEQPFSTWQFHPISEQIAPKPFGHGLGVGDINGDGRLDLIYSHGWFEQPESKADSSRWLLHPVPFTTSYGGAEMYVYDVDGDGDADVITSDAAHHFGLSWYEQIQNGDDIEFKHHVIMGEHPAQNTYGVVFTEPHSLILADIDQDGLLDIVTGKTYYSHHQQSPLWDAGAVVYWFRLVRTEDGVDWVPYLADSESGIGRQVIVGDVNKDGVPDIITGGMVGASVLTQLRSQVSREIWDQAQPKRYEGKSLPSLESATPVRGPQASLSEDSNRVVDAIEAETSEVTTTGGKAGPQSMENFKDGQWSGGKQLFWTGARIGDELRIPITAPKGKVSLEVVMTCAKDYGTMQLAVDEQLLGTPIDLYEPTVTTTGVLTFDNVEITTDNPQLIIQILGGNKNSPQARLFGIDYVRVVSDEKN